MNTTPSSERTTIVLAGRCNSGKSSLLNLLTGQPAALVADTAGTTTDPVRKAIEITGIGPCTIVDTPGLDDTGDLGSRRVALAEAELGRADMIVAVFNPGDTDHARAIAATLGKLHLPVIGVMTKSDLSDNPVLDCEALSAATGLRGIIAVSSVTGSGIDKLLSRLAAEYTGEPDSILGNLVEEGDTVLLVMPQDPQAPKGRLILPQSLTLRELLGRGCRAVCCVPGQLQATLDNVRQMPDLVITDSQVFREVNAILPHGCRLTSFSVLMAGYKGDIGLFMRGAEALDSLTEQSRVLIAEACTHTPQNEDIGRVKLPRLLRKAIGDGLTIDIVGGKDFPDDLTPYDLVIHCGGCMFTRRHVMSRVRRAEAAGVPVSNYGIVLARLSGAMPRLVIP